MYRIVGGGPEIFERKSQVLDSYQDTLETLHQLEHRSQTGHLELVRLPGGVAENMVFWNRIAK